VDDEKRMEPIREGDVVVCSSGEYSDYFIQGVFRALRAFDPNFALSAYLLEFPDQVRNFGASGFFAWLAKEGDMVEVNFRELWADQGSYGRHPQVGGWFEQREAES
jgi:hypothetical protein